MENPIWCLQQLSREHPEKDGFPQSLVEIVTRDQIVCGLPNIVECMCGQGDEIEQLLMITTGEFFTMNL